MGGIQEGSGCVSRILLLHSHWVSCTIFLMGTMNASVVAVSPDAGSDAVTELINSHAAPRRWRDIAILLSCSIGDVTNVRVGHHYIITNKNVTFLTRHLNATCDTV
jgi:hypothetical protein